MSPNRRWTATAHDMVLARLSERLLHSHFSSLQDLRHIAEGAGFSFVPVAKLHGSEHEMLVALRPQGAEVRVRATRVQSWHPFQVVAVEGAG